MGRPKKKRLPATPETIASDLAAIKRSFDEVGIPWVIIDGTVLGYARHREIMPWDNDLDIGVFVEVGKKQFSRLYTELTKNGFRVGRNKSDFMCGRRKSQLNLWMYHKKGKYYEAFPGTTPGLKFIEKAEWYDNPQMVEFLESIYPMPNHIDEYLDCRYGEDWRTNIKKDAGKVFIEKKGSRGGGLDWATGPSGKDGKYWPKILLVGDDM